MSKCRFKIPISSVWLLVLCITFPNRSTGEFSSATRSIGLKREVLADDNINIVQSYSEDDPIVTIKDGALRGYYGQTITGRSLASFRNVPYGMAPVDSWRFQAPRRNQPWTGIRDATEPSPLCIQIDYMTKERAIRGQEDCLNLEVHTAHLPQNETSRQNSLPVMVFFHGGSFAFGSGGLYGPYYLLDQGVVLVTVNFRLGPFGFLSTGNSAAYGNAGLKDQVLALHWVQENIAYFGGDPAKVTILGHSASAGAVQHHIVSPLSRGLFHRGISQSGSSLCWWAISENAPELAQKVANLFNCQDHKHDKDSQAMVQCLQKLPARELVTAQLYLSDWKNFPLVLFAPVIEPSHPGAFLSEHPTQIYRKRMASKVPWITGFTRYEMSQLFASFIQDTEAIAELNRDWNTLGEIFLTIRNATGDNSRTASRIREFYLGNGNTEIGYKNRYQVSQMLGDSYFLQCGLDGMHLHSKYTGEPVYAYEFSFEGKYSIVELYGQDAREWGVAHLDDVLYLLNNTEYFPQISVEDTNEYKMSRIITSTWAHFADFGIPYIGTKAESIWKPVQSQLYGNLPPTTSTFRFLDLNLNPKMVQNPYTERYQFWNDLNIIDED